MTAAAATLPPLTVYRRLLRYSLAHWPMFLAAVAGMVLFALSETAFAWLMKPLLDGSFVERDPGIIRWMPPLVLGLFLLRGAAAFLSDYYMADVGQRVIKTIRTELFDHFLRLPTAFYDRNASGQLLSSLTFNVDQVANAATQAVTVMIRDSLKVVGFMALMFYLNARLAIFALLITPVIALLIRWISKRFRRISTRIQHSMGELTTASEEMIKGQRLAKVFGAQDYEARRFEQVNERNRQLLMKRALTQAASNPVVQLVAAVPMAGIVYVATNASISGAMTPGAFAAFLGGMVGLLNPLKQLTTVNATLQRGIAAAGSIFALLEVAGEADTGRHAAGRVRGEIAFEGVRLSYDPAKGEVLKGIDLAVAPGQTVALVGRSGSGKTSLVNLLPRFYEAQAGRILIDGVDLRDYRLRDLRRQIAVVGQEVILFNDSVAANIAYGEDPRVVMPRIEAAARAAHAWEFIEKLPQGLWTPVGQHGVLLSGGQRQRLAIARALFKDAPILILDEATSALDTESERHIQAAFEVLMRGRTTLVIAHRLSTITRADCIVVMQDGRIVEQGTHVRLLAENGPYAELYRLQFNDMEAAG
jgi:subfamily B ATP-binding cassette protein MsbA